MTIDFKGPHEAALKIIKTAIQDKIMSNVPPPNAPSTIARKGSSNTLRDTDEMLNSVDIRISDEGGQIVGEVGFFDEENAQKAEWNERGTSKAPARPFFWPAVDESIDEAAETEVKMIFDQIENELMR
jgi:HK97 gp10 family phage protein